MSVEQMNTINRLKNEIKSIASNSQVPEDSIHAQNTLEWLVRLKPDADEALRIAALGHDIERAMERSKVKRENFSDFDTFKDAHARNSARILKNIIQEYALEENLKEEICRLVRYHETGGDLRSNLIRDADSLSFFEVNLPLFFEREGWDNAAERCHWGYKRLSPYLRHIIQKFTYDSNGINALLRTVIQKFQGINNAD